MCTKKQSNFKRPPRKPRQGPYRTVNAYTIKTSAQQVLTIILMLLLITLHSTCIVTSVLQINSQILFILFSLYYFSLIVLIVDYVNITRFDPVDRFLIDKAKLQFFKIHNPSQLVYCEWCRTQRHQRSYHCGKCDRCTEGFDHHCAFLGTCIGRRNYEMFMRILLVFIFYNIVLISQTAWVFQASLEGDWRRWVCIPIFVVSGGLFVGACVLCGFHIHISCCLDLTTIEFIQSSSESNRRSVQSAEDLNREEIK